MLKSLASLAYNSDGKSMYWYEDQSSLEYIENSSPEEKCRPAADVKWTSEKISCISAPRFGSCLLSQSIVCYPDWFNHWHHNGVPP